MEYLPSLASYSYSVTPWGHLHTGCVVQGFEVLDSQDQTEVVWAGDMNWNAEDGEPPLPAGWYEPSTL